MILAVIMYNGLAETHKVMEKLFLDQNYLLKPQVGIALALIYIWSLIWKAFALWQAAQNKERKWFIVLLLVNSAGILEILYLFTISKKKFKLSQPLKG